MNLRLVPATLATGAKYSRSGLKAIRFGEEKEKTQFDGWQNDPYPLVQNKDLLGRDMLVPLWIGGTTGTYFFPEAVVNLSRERNIVATPVLNGRGTVKEMITDGDFELTISLAVVSNNEAGEFAGSGMCLDQYPYAGVEQVRTLLEEPGRLLIQSDFLKSFQLDGGECGIVVKSYSVHQETHTNRQVFEIVALSDYDYELIIKS